MRKNLWKLSLACLLVVMVVSSAEAQKVRKISANLVEVTVVGKGMSETEALRDAHRKAVETGAGSYIYSQSKTKDFVLVKDTIIARSAGFVQSTTVLAKKQDEDDVWSVKIKAVVSVKGIADAWGVTINLLKQMGRPKIMVFISEKVGRRRIENSTVQTRIENLLLKSGFLLVNKNQLKAIDRKDLAAAIANDKPAMVQAIAKRFGAQLFISGSANAASGGAKRIGGVVFHAYEAEANIKCYRSDTAQLLSSIPGAATRGVQRVANSAAKQALDSQAKMIAPKVRNDILRFWQDALEGRGEVIIEVSGIPKYSRYSKLKRALKKIKGVKSVKGNFHNKVAKMSIESDTNAETLADRISEAMEDVIEIDDTSQNVIKAKYVGK